MKRSSRLLTKERVKLGDDAFVDVRVVEVPVAVPGSAHTFKYAFAYVVAGDCVLRYGNEAGKGDHKHVGQLEMPYIFTTLEKLVDDFWADVAQL